jgi:hypothetical protein
LPIVRSFDPELPADRYVGDGTTFKALAARLQVPLTALDDVIAATTRDAEYWEPDPRLG